MLGGTIIYGIPGTATEFQSYKRGNIGVHGRNA